MVNINIWLVFWWFLFASVTFQQSITYFQINFRLFVFYSFVIYLLGIRFAFVTFTPNIYFFFIKVILSTLIILAPFLLLLLKNAGKIKAKESKIKKGSLYISLCINCIMIAQVLDNLMAILSVKPAPGSFLYMIFSIPKWGLFILGFAFLFLIPRNPRNSK